MDNKKNMTVKSEAEKPKKFSFNKIEIEESDRLRKLSFSVDFDNNSDNSEVCSL